MPSGALLEVISVPDTDKLGEFIAKVRLVFSDASTKDCDVPVKIVAKKYVVVLKFKDENGNITTITINKSSGENLSADEIKKYIPEKYLPAEIIEDVSNINGNKTIEIAVVNKQSFLFVPEIVGLQVSVGSPSPVDFA